MDIDRFMEETRDAILDHGYTVQYSDVRADSFGHLPRAHTVGRTLFGRSELLIVGPFTQEQMGEMLSELVAQEEVAPGVYTAGSEVEAANRRWRFIEAEPSALIGAMATFGPIDALQAVWANPDGTFPGEPQMLRPRDTHPLHPTTDPYHEEDSE